MSKEIVITGVGVVSPLGIGAEAFWESLAAGRSGVRVRPQFENSDLPLRLYAPVEGFDGRKIVKPRKAIKVMCLPIQHGYAAAQLAFDDSGLDLTTLEPDRVGTVFGTETFFADPLEVSDVFRHCTVDHEYHHHRWGEYAMRDIQPLWMLKYLPNMVASHISIALDARGPNNSICQAEASGLLALVEGADLIRRGLADVVVVGATGAKAALSALLYRGLENLSHRIHDPEGAARPFDADRDGLIAGEGAGAVILESADHAAARGARVLGALGGWCRTFCPPESDAVSAALATALTDSVRHADLDPTAIGHYHAHATGERELDRWEAQAVRESLQDVPVYAAKAVIGHLGPSSSIVELIAGLLSRRAGTLPPNINFATPDPECPVNVSRSAVAIDSAAPWVKLSHSFTGQIVSLVLT